MRISDWSSDVCSSDLPLDATQYALLTRLAESQRPLVATLLAEDAPLTSTPEAYLKLHLLSHRLAKPHGLNLTGIFPLLPNVAWTNQEIGRASCRERVSVRVDLGGRRIIKKKKHSSLTLQYLIIIIIHI